MTDTDLWAEVERLAANDHDAMLYRVARLALRTKDYADAAIRAEAQAVHDTETDLAAAREDADYHRAVVDALKAKHEGGSGAFWAEWHRDHCAAAKAADAARVEVADLRDRLAAVGRVVQRMKTRNVDHRHEGEIGAWGVQGRAYFRAVDIYDDYADLVAALGDADTLVKARVKAEALREFADECDGPDSSLYVMGAAQAARERAARIEGEHHPNCYQVVGVPDDLPDDLCDCRVLRLVEGATNNEEGS